LGGGVPEARGSVEVAKGFQRGGVFVQLHARHADDYNSPGGDVFNSSWEDRGVLAHLTHAIGNGLLSAAWQTDDVRDAGRPRNNSRVVRFYYPFETSHRLTTTYELPALGEFRQVAFTGFVGTYRQRTDQDDLRRRQPAGASSAPTSMRRTFTSEEARSDWSAALVSNSVAM
jgi:hypothetical protein